MAESTRPLSPLTPLPNGGWEVQSLMSSTDFTIRGLGLMPPNSIVPVIVVPGIMGTNLRARAKPHLSRKRDERNRMAKPGAAVWRAPNGLLEARSVAGKWDEHTPRERQLLFDGATLEVDDSGPISFPGALDGYVLSESDARLRGWGEVHAGSYGRLLFALQMHLNQTFGFNDATKQRFVSDHWLAVMATGPRQWGGDIEMLTEAHLAKHAHHYFPVYAVGYNWLEDCAVSARRLEQRIAGIVAYWQKLNRSCDKVILVTHSMGGLVTRACAQRVPARIAGIIHGVMPAFGAPAAYRRLACGTEDTNYGNGMVFNMITGMVAQLQGNTPEKTTPVMATAPGILELLPNHLHPQPWLQIRAVTRNGTGPGPGAAGNGLSRESSTDCLQLPGGALSNPYQLYRDMTSWYRLINPALVDPAGKWLDQPGGAIKAIEQALTTAENFHRALGDYYHPNTHAFYGADPRKLSYGKVRWSARQRAGSAPVLTPANVAGAKSLSDGPDTRRRVLVEARSVVEFEMDPQDAAGDGTVSQLSGAGPAGKVKHLFAARGLDHQNAFNDERMLRLTLRLVVKIVQELP